MWQSNDAALELLWLSEKACLNWDEAMLNNEEIKPVAIAISESRLSEGISE